MDNAVETLDSIINQFKDFKLDIFNNKISSQTIKNSAYNLKVNIINHIFNNNIQLGFNQ